MNLAPFRDGPPGEIAVLGLGRSGRAVALLLAGDGHDVYASDAGTSDGLSATARELEQAGVSVETGGHDLARIRSAALVVASPGIPPDAPPLRAACAAGRAPVGEVEIALHYLQDVSYVAVTGTNGKTTTTAMIGHLLRALGHDAPEAGNIGTPLAAVALRPPAERPAWVALELSSFQLHDTPSVRPTVGVLTNLSPDHLDRYPSVEAYYADKSLLFRNADESSHWVVNVDDAEAMAMAAPAAGTRWTFSTAGAPAQARYDRASEQIELLGAPLLERAALPLLGDHNVANALAAVLAVAMAHEAHRTQDARARMASALRTFAAPPHRLEPVGEWDGVLWINDSKATNLASTLMAVRGMTRPFVLLLGGRHKGEPYTAIADPFARFGRTVLAYGEAAPLIERDLARRVPVERVDGAFETVVARARALARPGDAVLLSPACSSFDMFDNYEQRGAAFRRLAAGEQR